jgi:hypothetical protein
MACMRRISLTVRQVRGSPSLPVVSRLPERGSGPDRCPQGVGPLSGPAAVTGPGSGWRAGRSGRGRGGD